MALKKGVLLAENFFITIVIFPILDYRTFFSFLGPIFHVCLEPLQIKYRQMNITNLRLMKNQAVSHSNLPAENRVEVTAGRI